jgi:hypothetical protein
VSFLEVFFDYNNNKQEDENMMKFINEAKINSNYDWSVKSQLYIMLRQFAQFHFLIA